MRSLLLTSFLGLCALSFSSAAFAADSGLTIVAKDGAFSPARIEVPADQKVKIVIKNQDKSMVEFESYKLNREDRIQPGTEETIFVGPLKSGEYEFFDDNNPDAKGVVVAK